VIAGFFSASTLWPNLHVTAECARGRGGSGTDGSDASRNATRGYHVGWRERRILIARALVHRPQQLLLDEPPTRSIWLPNGTARDASRAGREGTGLVMVTHHLGDILPEIERIILMRDGRIVADGPREQLLTEDRLSELFRAPVRIGRDAEWLHSW